MTCPNAFQILAVPDKFRGTATAREVAAAIAAAAASVGASCHELPLADGGEGTVDALGGANRVTRVTGPLREPVEASWRLAPDEFTSRAVIEMSAASGLLLAGGADNNDPLAATTRGTGELIRAAIAAGAREIVVGVGGSATTDGGAGALEIVVPDGKSVIPQSVKLTVLTDVSTVFTDAARVFGPQKGADPDHIVQLTHRLEVLRDHFRDQWGIDVDELPGSGAAGGLAGGLAAVGATLTDGFGAIAAAVDLDAALDAADLVITGEGRFDTTSLTGKVVGSVIDRARLRDLPVWVVAGSVADDVPESEAERVINLTEHYGEQAARNNTATCITRAVTESLQLWQPIDTSVE